MAGPLRAESGRPFGLFQVVADMIKIFTKEDWIPPFADKPVLSLAPAIIMVTVLMSFAVVPLHSGIIVADLNVGLLFFLAMSSLGVTAWCWLDGRRTTSTRCCGRVRAAAQMLGYEVFMGLSLMGVVMLAGSFNLVGSWRPAGALVLHSAVSRLRIVRERGHGRDPRLALRSARSRGEIGRRLSHGVSGMKFGMFFVGEYLGITLISALIAMLFFGGWLGPGCRQSLVLHQDVRLHLFFILLRAPCRGRDSIN